MWVWLGRAAMWLGNAAAGWVVGDIINEASTTKQVEAASGNANQGTTPVFSLQGIWGFVSKYAGLIVIGLGILFWWSKFGKRKSRKR